MTKDAKGHDSEKKERVWWHGSPDRKIETFDPDKTKRGVYGRGVYVTRRKDIAEGYAGENGRVYPVHIDTSRTLDLTTKEGQDEFKKSHEDDLRKKYDVIRAPGQSVVLNAKAIRHAEEEKREERGESPTDRGPKSINARGDTFKPRDKK